jgi:hypothetical protein
VGASSTTITMTALPAAAVSVTNAPAVFGDGANLMLGATYYTMAP